MAAINDDRILTLHPEGKEGVRIPLKNYNMMVDTLLSILAEHPEISYKDLTRLTEARLAGMYPGSILWLMETVKLDLLARGIIRKTRNNPVWLSLTDTGQ